MNSLTLAFAQTQSAGRLMGQDLLQYINAGFNPLNEISKMTGISMGVLKDKMEKGAISAEMVTKAFQHATSQGGMFHDSLKNAADTVTGKWGIFMGTVQTKLVAVGDMLKPLTTGVIDFGNSLLNGEPAALALAVAIGGVTLAIYGTTIATSALSAATAIWNAVTKANPIVLVISLLIALGLWIYSITKKYEGWGNSTRALWEVTKSFFTNIGIGFKSMYETIVYYLDYAGLKLKDWAQTSVQFAANIGTALSQALHGNFKQALDTIRQEIKTGADAEITALEKKHAQSQASFKQQSVAAVSNIKEEWQKVGLTKIPGAEASGVIESTQMPQAGEQHFLLTILQIWQVVRANPAQKTSTAAGSEA